MDWSKKKYNEYYNSCKLPSLQHTPSSPGMHCRRASQSSSLLARGASTSFLTDCHLKQTSHGLRINTSPGSARTRPPTPPNVSHSNPLIYHTSVGLACLHSRPAPPSSLLGVILHPLPAAPGPAQIITPTSSPSTLPIHPR